MTEKNQQNQDQDPKYSFRSEAPLPREERVVRFLETLKEILGAKIYDLPLEMYLGTCAKCNNCAEQCQVYQTSGDQRDLPAWRSDLLRKVYKKYFTRSGKLFGKLVGAKALTEEDIDDMVDAFYRCTMCRRCGVNCPLAVDNALITRVGRVLLASLGFVPKNVTASVRSQLGEAGNTSAIPKAAFVDTLDFLEEELAEEAGIPIPIPRDVEGAEYFFAAPVSDYIMEADTLMGIAKTFHAAGASWTVSTENYDAINYGLFYSDEVLEKILNRLLDAAHRLKCKTIVIGECGHATKAGLIFKKIYGRPEYQGIQFKNIIEVSHRFLKEGKLRFDPEKNPDTYTYHDPCNLGRGAGLYEQPRELLKAAVKHFVEMTPNREMNYCCGGGGGLVVVEDLHDWRMSAGGIKKVDQIRLSGAKFVVAPCANCKKQLKELVQGHKLDAEITGLHDVLSKALVFQKNA
jgi:Fe-S oxidoreductase